MRSVSSGAVGPCALHPPRQSAVQTAVKTSGDIQNYLQRFIERLDRRREGLEKKSALFSRIRLGIALGGAVATYLVYQSSGSPLAWATALFFAGAFGVAAYFHSRIILGIRKHRIYAGIKAAHIARIDRDWNGIPETRFEEAEATHPFARDLNLTGPHSLHHLLDTSFTLEGSARLRDWLLDPIVDPASSLERQALVRELKPMMRFRDRLTLLSELVTSAPEGRWEGDAVLAWLNRHIDGSRIRVVLFILFGLAAVTAVLLAMNIFGDLGPLWLISFLLYVSVYLLNSRLYAELFDEAEHLYDQLNRFRPVLIFLENERFKAGTRLADVCAPLQEAGKPPSAFLRTIMWLSVAASTQKSEVLRLVLNIVMPWDLLFTVLLHGYKTRLRDRLPRWLDAIRTLEAANSLATFAALHPEYGFPEIEPSRNNDEPLFRATGLGHPLLSDKENVRNDFQIDSIGRIALITGSNMSGKSTFLRTLGANYALALAGGPVNAETFATRPFRLFTCLNVIDSVTDGISYFYAEVKRLKCLLEELQRNHDHPLLFLVDEIFRGTNNRERLIGSRALLLSLVAEDGVGVVSTHDLELVKLEKESSGIQNYHFRETVENGRMQFDYTLRPGPCPTTNALTIMQMEGLPVELPSDR